MSNYYGKKIKEVKDHNEYRTQFCLGTIDRFELVAIYDEHLDEYNIYRHQGNDLFFVDTMSRAGFLLREGFKI